MLSWLQATVETVPKFHHSFHFIFHLHVVESKVPSLEMFKSNTTNTPVVMLFYGLSSFNA